MRERCLPPQIVSSDFEGKLAELLVPKDALSLYELLRGDFQRQFPLLCSSDEDEKGVSEMERLMMIVEYESGR